MRPKIAIAGTNGNLGPVVLDTLLSNSFIHYFELPIRVLTRSQSRLRPRAGGDRVNYRFVDYNDPATLDVALSGVDVVVNLLGLHYDAWDELARAANRTGVQLYLPSEFGADCTDAIPMPLSYKRDHAEDVRAMGMGMKVVQLFCGMFMERAIPDGQWLGVSLSRGQIDPAVVPYDEGPEPTITFTSTQDVANTIAMIIGLFTPKQLPNRITIAGSSCTMTELASIWMAHTGIPVQIRQITAASYRPIAQQQERTGGLYRLAAGEGELDLSRHNDNDLVNQGEQNWQWMTVERFIAIGIKSYSASYRSRNEISPTQKRSGRSY